VYIRIKERVLVPKVLYKQQKDEDEKDADWSAKECGVLCWLQVVQEVLFWVASSAWLVGSFVGCK
jgi:hypothetical protein